jgi:hypothetical protein
MLMYTFVVLEGKRCLYLAMKLSIRLVPGTTNHAYGLFVINVFVIVIVIVIGDYDDILLCRR